MLESNLVQSARLSLNWPPNDNAKPIRSRVINISRRDRYTLALCRWLFTLDRHRVRILCYDLDGADNLTTEERCSILYKCDKGWKLDVMRFEQTLLDERSGDENHPVGFLLATMFDAASPLRKSALYSVILADGMFPTLYFVLDAKGPSTMDIGPRLLAIFTPSGGPQDVLFVDIETYQCCRFPESASSSPQKPFPQDDHNCKKLQIVLSSSHVLLFRQYDDPPRTYIHAYAIPSHQGSGSESLADQSSISPPLALQLTHVGTAALKLGSQCTLLLDSKVEQITKTIHVDVVVVYSDAVSVAVSLKLNLAIQSIGSITVESPKNRISTATRPTLLHPLLIAHSLNGSTRSVTYFQRDGIMHVVAMVLDDEDSATTHTVVDTDMRCFQELQLSQHHYIIGFDAYRGRLATSQFYDDAITIYDFV